VSARVSLVDTSITNQVHQSSTSHVWSRRCNYCETPVLVTVKSRLLTASRCCWPKLAKAGWLTTAAWLAEARSRCWIAKAHCLPLLLAAAGQSWLTTAAWLAEARSRCWIAKAH
jgi:hypothetical protein